MWIYFSSFTQYSLVEPRRVESGEREEEGSSAAPPSAGAAGASGASCGVELRVWDAAGALGRYCDSAPALCARAALANATRAPRPCAPPDGYVSRGALLALSAASRAGTATHPLGFALHYEFVDARVPGAALASRGAAPPQCARLLQAPGALASPRNALWFGRGGARRLRCVYRLQGAARVTLDLARATFGLAPRCVSRAHPLTGRLACFPLPAEEAPADDAAPEWDDGEDNEPLRVPHLKIYESPWPGYRVSAVPAVAPRAVSVAIAFARRRCRSRACATTRRRRCSWRREAARSSWCWRRARCARRRTTGTWGSAASGARRRARRAPRAAACRRPALISTSPTPTG